MINKRYIVSKKLGEGRSKVFNVIDTEFPDREVAAKFLSSSASIEEKEFFREEFFILQKLDHPNIIKSFELSRDRKVLFFHYDGIFSSNSNLKLCRIERGKKTKSNY